MKAAFAQFGHAAQPGHVLPLANGHHRHRHISTAQRLNKLRHAVLFIGIAAISQHNDMLHLLITAGQGLGRSLQAGAHINPAAARANGPNLGDDGPLVLRQHRANHLVRLRVHGNHGDFVKVIE